MIYELRTYRFRPGRKKIFLKGFKKATRFMKKYGVRFVAAWENLERKNEFIWVRAFPSVKARERATDRYYSSPEWLAVVHMLRPSIRRRTVRIMRALRYSPLR